jgi:hypothetical protein
MAVPSVFVLSDLETVTGPQYRSLVLSAMEHDPASSRTRNNVLVGYYNRVSLSSGHVGVEEACSSAGPSVSQFCDNADGGKKEFLSKRVN